MDIDGDGQPPSPAAPTTKGESVEELKKSPWNPMWMPFPTESEVLLRPVETPGFGVPGGAPFFCSAAPRPSASRSQGVPRSANDPLADQALRMEQPMFIIDAHRLIRLRNASGAALLSRRDLLLEQGGAVTCRHPDSDRRMAAAVRGMESDGGDGQERRAVWLRRADGLTAAATLHALRYGEGARHSSIRFLLTVLEPGARKRADPELLVAAYRLTAAEARLAALIAGGHGTEHCARMLRVKTCTLRSHLVSIYRKTGANGKADLVRLVLSLCAA